MNYCWCCFQELEQEEMHKAEQTAEIGSFTMTTEVYVCNPCRNVHGCDPPDPEGCNNPDRVRFTYA